jgi:hypothetical protein
MWRRADKGRSQVQQSGVDAYIADATTGEGMRPLHISCCSRQTETSSLLLESESPVVDEDCQVDRRIGCLVADNFVLDEQILLVERRQKLLDPTLCLLE